MSDTLRRIVNLVQAGDVLISAHGYHEMAEDSILAGQLIAGVAEAVLVEDYPDYPKGPCSLVLQRDRSGNPIHAVWGIPRGPAAPAALVTAYAQIRLAGPTISFGEGNEQTTAYQAGP